MHPPDPDSDGLGPSAWRSKLIIRYTDGTDSEERFREAPHDYAMHLSMLTTVDSVRIEVSRSGQPECYEYRAGIEAGQAP